jgi:hypothetical protein
MGAKRLLFVIAALMVCSMPLHAAYFVRGTYTEGGGDYDASGCLSGWCLDIDGDGSGGPTYNTTTTLTMGSCVNLTFNNLKVTVVNTGGTSKITASGTNSTGKVKITLRGTGTDNGTPGDGDFRMNITLASTPKCAIYDARDVTGSSAGVSGILLHNGSMCCEYRFAYWKECNGEVMTTAWKSASGNILSTTIDGLDALTSYNFQMELKNPGGTGKSLVRQFRTPPCSTGLTYIDATIGACGNTTYATGGEVNADDPGTVPSGKDNLWRGRAFANNGTIFESGGSWEGNGNIEDCPRLKTTVPVPPGCYDVYVNFWADAAQWRIGASLENLDDNVLPLSLANDVNDPSAYVNAIDYGCCGTVPMLAEGNRFMWQAYLGTITTDEIVVYIDDEPNHLTGNSRTWYDGISIQPAAPGITYVDATIGEGGNTTYATGGEVTADDPGTVPSGKDNLWRQRAFATDGTIFESGGSWEGNGNIEDCPRLKTSVEVEEGDYDVYVYFWADAAQWRIGASLEDLEDNVLPLFLANDPNNPLSATVKEFGCNALPMMAEGNRTLFVAALGNTGVTSVIDVYIDDEPNHLTGNSRTWYDGIGYKPASPKIVYVDATVGAGGNTTLADGSEAIVDDPGTVPSGKDNLWRPRAFATNGTIFESGGSWEGNGNIEDCPRLRTTVAVPMGCYEVFVYQWADAAQWRIGASLENSADNVLPLYLCNDVNDLATVYANALDFGDVVPMLAEGNRFLWQVSLGNIGPTDVIDVYIDDEPNHLTGNSRTWYDGIGYRAR